MEQVYIKGFAKAVNPFFVSDLHFGHKNVIEYCNRPTTPEQHDDWLVECINKSVGVDDIVYHLGDFSLKRDKEYLTSIMRRLNGKWFFVLGNHDVKSALAHAANETDNTVLGWYWSERFYKDQQCKDLYADVKMMHFPIESWDCKQRGSIHVHGHMHHGTSNNGVGTIKNRIDVGIDGKHAPYHISDVMTILANGSND